MFHYLILKIFKLTDSYILESSADFPWTGQCNHIALHLRSHRRGCRRCLVIEWPDKFYVHEDIHVEQFS